MGFVSLSPSMYKQTDETLEFLMEHIEINGFLTIDHASFEIKKINILIGAQAQGKSIIAKLVYFFKSFFSDTFLESIQKFETKRDIEKKCLLQFEQIFPRYSWTNQDFSIIYKNGDYEVSIIRTKIGNKYILKFNYCKELADFHKKLKNCYKIALNEFDSRVDQDNGKKTRRRESIFHETIAEKIYDSASSNAFKRPIFIPASRSFFANLQKNIFSFLASNIDIDPFIKEFGSRYEQSKRFHQTDFLRHRETNEIIRKKVDKLISDIVVGEYIYAD